MIISTVTNSNSPKKNKTMIKITCAGLYTYHVDSITLVKDKAVLVLDENRGVKMIPSSDIIRMEDVPPVHNPVRKSTKVDDLESALALQLAIYFNMMQDTHTPQQDIASQVREIYRLRNELDKLK